ncbi:MAG: Cas10/Cmr2 second palm domain-containing protein, partial [Armatimonadota bacterium]
CRLLTRDWQEQLPDSDERKGLVDNAFYLLYAGGDDLMVIGPWNLTLVLARCVRDDFAKYCGDNPNMTISAGIIFVKPKFPIHRFSVLAGEALEQSKDAGRNCITAFNAMVNWDAYGQALDFGKDLTQAIERNEMPRTFIHFLWHLYRKYVREEGANPLWAPLFHYMVARRVKKETVERLKLLERIPKLICERAMPIALGYAILATRERKRSVAEV